VINGDIEMLFLSSAWYTASWSLSSHAPRNKN